MLRKYIILCLLAAPLSMRAQTDISWEVAAQTTNSSGDYTPLWLNANKHGLSSLDKNNGYLMAGVEKPMTGDSIRKWSYGFGASMAAAYGFTSPIVVQEAYVEGRWLKGVLTLGSKEWEMELKNDTLSSGSQTFGINARPVPQLRIALPDYWTFAGGWLGIKGHISYGMTTDDGWQKDFTDKKSKYTENVLYHSKAGYIRIGNVEKSRLSVELGLEMASLFGGTSYRKWENGELVGVKNSTSFSSFWNAFVCGGNDVGYTIYQNVEGDMLGSWVARVNYDAPTWNLGVYADHYFEDHSSMFLLDYDGYGEGSEWNEKKDNKYLFYGLKDIMLGAELTLKKCSWIKKAVVEYLYTKYQSGPIYHDHTANIPDHIGGFDKYYNHSIFTGWQHWGQVMGNPLYMSPIYNTDGTIEVKDNRFVAWHGGLSGSLSRALDYRLLATYQKGWGTYENMYPSPRRNVSLLAEAKYSAPVGGWQVVAALGMDKGSLLGDNFGFQLTIIKKGVFR